MLYTSDQDGLAWTSASDEAWAAYAARVCAEAAERGQRWYEETAQDS